MKKLKLYPTDQEYLGALKRKRQEIAEGLEFNFVDCTDMGATICSWGLNQNDTERYGISVYTGDKQVCPLCRSKRSSGCFWDCRVHKPSGGVSKISREECLKLFDAAIAEAQKDK